MDLSKQAFIQEFLFAKLRETFSAEQHMQLIEFAGQLYDKIIAVSSEGGNDD